jgi:predicted transcriptional regulator
MAKPGPERVATTEKLLMAIRDAYPPALGTSDIAESLGVKRQTVDKHLRSIAEEGLVDTDMVGQSRIWWLTDDGRKWLSERTN